MKLLTVSDFGVKTGFARVMESIVDRLPKKWHITSLGINYYGDPYPTRVKLYPASLGGDLYGIRRLRGLIEKVKPDKVLILQDSWIVQEYLKVIPEEFLKNVIIYTPVDAGPYQYSWLEKYPLVKQVCAYTEFGRQIISEANPSILNIKVIPHGVDTTTFYPIDQTEARKGLGKIDEDLFVILNANWLN
jgi:glycosyltransferase involved in cell wall biosynthesis